MNNDRHQIYKMRYNFSDAHARTHTHTYTYAYISKSNHNDVRARACTSLCEYRCTYTDVHTYVCMHMHKNVIN